MTVRYYCDVCNGDVEDPDPQRQFFVDLRRTPTPADFFDKKQPTIERVGIRLLRSIDGIWNGGHICDTCLSRALATIVQLLSPPPAPEVTITLAPAVTCPECIQGKCANCTRTIPVGDGPEVVPCHCRASSHESQAVDA